MPKPYKLPNNYVEWEHFANHAKIFSLVTPKPISIFGIPSTLENIAFLFAEWQCGEYPVYCLRENLLQQMLETEVGEKLSLFEDIRLSMPSFILFFPKKTVLSPSSGYINYLVIRHEKLELPDHKDLISWACTDSEDNLILGYKRIRRDGTLQASAFSGDDPAQQKRALNLRDIVLQSILFLQYYPELIEESSPLPPPKTRGFAQSRIEQEYRLPRWLGKKKKTRQAEQEGEKVGGCRVGYWRQGHWRQQACGKDRKERKPLWIEPFWTPESTEEKARIV